MRSLKVSAEEITPTRVAVDPRFNEREAEVVAERFYQVLTAHAAGA